MNNRQETKLLAVDLDGTALNDSHQFSPATVQAFRELRGRGHILCFVTGRRGVDMDPLGEHAYLPDYAVLNSGAQVLDMQRHRPLMERFIPRQVAEELVSHCLEQRLLLNVCARDHWSVNIVDEGVRSYARRIRREPLVYSSPEELPLERIEGFTATAGSEETVAFIRRQGFDLYYVMSEPEAYDIIPGGINKWRSLKWLADRLGIPTERIVAAGNYHNDIEMIRGAGVGVAVQNALPEVKAAADYVTRRTNDQDGVVELIQRFFFDISI